jgi:sugar phosphate isomerase/epimerase
MHQVNPAEVLAGRRTFLKSLTRTAAGCAAAGLPIAGGLGWESAATAIEPVNKPGSHQFKYSLAAYSYRNLLTGKDHPLTLEDFIGDCAKAHLDGTELTSYYFPKPLPDDYLRQIKELCFRSGLAVSGTAIGNDFCHPPGEARDEQIRLAKQWIRNAEVLGAPVIRIFSGKPHGTDDATAKRMAIEAIEECCQYAGEHGVYLCLENHGGLTAQVDGMLELVRAVRSPWFGVNLDSGNFNSSDPYGDLAKIAPYARNVQIKVVTSGPDRRKEPTDFNRLAKMLADVGYRGYIVLEYEEAEDPRVACPRYLEVIRKAFTSV